VGTYPLSQFGGRCDCRCPVRQAAVVAVQRILCADVLQTEPIACLWVRSTRHDPGEQPGRNVWAAEVVALSIDARGERQPTAQDTLQDGAALRRGATEQPPPLGETILNDCGASRGIGWRLATSVAMARRRS